MTTIADYGRRKGSLFTSLNSPSTIEAIDNEMFNYSDQTPVGTLSNNSTTDWNEFAQGLSMPVFIKPVETQAHLGNKQLVGVVEFFRAVSKAHKNFAKEIETVVAQERQRLSSEPDGMIVAGSAWFGIVEAVSQLGQAHQAMADKGKSEVYHSLKSFIPVQDTKIKMIKSDSRKAMIGVKALKAELDKIRSRAAKSAEVIMGDPTSQKTTVGAFIQNRMKSQSPEEKINTNLDMLEAYNDSITNANTFVRSFYARDLPNIMNKYQIREQRRLDEQLKKLQVYSGLMKEFSESCRSCTNTVEISINQMNNMRDIQGFVGVCSMNAENVAIPEEYQFDLFKWDILSSLEDLRKQAKSQLEKSKALTVPSDFQDDLESIMHRQKAIYPNVQIPLVFIRLWDQVKLNGGFQTEGIFRIAPDSEKLVAYQNSVVLGKYEVPESDPHLPASLLKKWLRDLPHPLIPAQFYNSCIQLANSGKPNRESFESLMAGLPELNRLIIYYLLLNLKILCDPETIKVTRMNSANLGIVFGPCLLKGSATDASSMMLNAKNETRFADFLIQVFTKDDLSAHSIEDPERKVPANTQSEKKDVLGMSMSMKDKKALSGAALLLMDPLAAHDVDSTDDDVKLAEIQRARSGGEH